MHTLSRIVRHHPIATNFAKRWIASGSKTPHGHILENDTRQIKLFTPGPVMVSDRVKKAMFMDIGHRHSDFDYVVKYVRKALLKIADVDPEKFTAIPFGASGTTAKESLLTSLFSQDQGKVLILENGFYSRRFADMCRTNGIRSQTINVTDYEALEKELKTPNDTRAVFIVHCETGSGVVNPIEEIGEIIKKSKPDCLYVVDAMSSFGGIPIDMKNIDFVISSSGKCLQSVSGVSFIIGDKEILQKNRGKVRGTVMDAVSHLDALEITGQFRHTFPTHDMLAFREALMEFEDEGGIAGRSFRFRENAKLLRSEMDAIGFQNIIDPTDNPNGYIVSTFHYPDNSRFIFERFYEKLSEAGQIICSARGSPHNCFRIGTIGNLYLQDIRTLAKHIRSACYKLRIEEPMPASKPLVYKEAKVEEKK